MTLAVMEIKLKKNLFFFPFDGDLHGNDRAGRSREDATRGGSGDDGGRTTLKQISPRKDSPPPSVPPPAMAISICCHMGTKPHHFILT